MVQRSYAFAIYFATRQAAVYLKYLQYLQIFAAGQAAVRVAAVHPSSPLLNRVWITVNIK